MSVRCPKCFADSENSVDCSKCGVNFAGYQQFLTHKASRPSSVGDSSDSTSLDKGFRRYYWLIVFAVVAILLMDPIRALVIDLRTKFFYRQTLCQILDAEMTAGTSVVRRRRIFTTKNYIKVNRTHKVSGVPVLSTGYYQGEFLGRVGLFSSSTADEVLSRFKSGTEVPCWYRPSNPLDTVLTNHFLMDYLSQGWVILVNPIFSILF